MGNALGAPVYVLDQKGKFLATSADRPDELPKAYNDDLLGRRTTDINTAPCALSEDTKVIVPLLGGEDRLGTLIVALDDTVNDDTLVVVECGATVISMALAQQNRQDIEERGRKKAACDVALRTLSFREQTLVEHLVDELDGEEQDITITQVAESAGITRSVAVDALRKLVPHHR